ncbi:MAG: LysR family transcriptional regulator [Pseudomonas sp.]
MKLQQLHVLVAVHESGSLLGASRRLHVTQPALSRALKELEDELGVPLLIRSSKGVRLTPYGESFLKHARNVLEGVRRARQDINDMKGQSGVEVRIGVTTAAALMEPVKDALVDFHLKHPEVRLVVVEQRPQQMHDLLLQGMLDFVVTSLIPEQSSLMEWLPICKRNMHIVARRGHPLANARSLRQLIWSTWITRDSLDNPNSPLRRLFGQNRLPLPEQIIQCESNQITMDLIMKADALFLAVNETNDTGHPDWLGTIQIEERVPESFIGIVCPDPQLLTRPAARLLEQIRENLLQHYPHF